MKNFCAGFLMSCEGADFFSQQYLFAAAHIVLLITQDPCDTLRGKITVPAKKICEMEISQIR